MRGEDFVDRLPEQQVRVADDTCVRAHLTVVAARALSGDLLYKVRLADRPERLGPRIAVTGSAFNEDSLFDAMGAGIGEQFTQQISAAVAIPEVMVWIADREIGLEGFFFPG
jgi:hypothetical protein